MTARCYTLRYTSYAALPRALSKQPTCSSQGNIETADEACNHHLFGKQLRNGIRRRRSSRSELLDRPTAHPNAWHTAFITLLTSQPSPSHPNSIHLCVAISILSPRIFSSPSSQFHLRFISSPPQLYFGA